ncbi:hypothetical protein SLA2020_387630 [Shorea laevis]
MAGKSDAVSVKVPVRNLRKEEEVDMLDEPRHWIHHNSSSNSTVPPSPTVLNGSPDSSPPIDVRSRQQCGLMTLILSCTVAAGVQFGWALQLSLLTPYIQEWSLDFALQFLIRVLCPSVRTCLAVQPCVGIWSDKCTSKFRRRQPFILAGALMISAAVIIIGFAADIGYILDDTKEHCSTFKGTRTRAAIIFVIGFWMLDLANNTVHGPARALLADLSGPEQRNSANAVFCSWMAVGNILGLSAGASGNWHRWFPFLTNRACCEACGNLKAAFLVAVVFLTLCTLVTIYFAKEVPLPAPEQPNCLSDSAPLLDDPTENGLELSKLKHDRPVVANACLNNSENGYQQYITPKHGNSKVVNDQNENFSDGPGAVLVNLLTSLGHLPPAMHLVLIVSALSWGSLSWCVREGAFGLLLNSVVLGISSFFIEPMCQWMGARIIWAMRNCTVFACMAVTAIISLISVREYSQGIEHAIEGNEAIKIAALIVFALLGFPLAVTYSVPFSVMAELTADSGGGQGLAIGVLNLSIVIPLMIISLGAGPWDALFGGGNIPAFILAAFCALAAGIIATRKLPDLSRSSSSHPVFILGNEPS